MTRQKVFPLPTVAAPSVIICVCDNHNLRSDEQKNHEKLTLRWWGGVVNPYGQPDCKRTFFYDSPKLNKRVLLTYRPTEHSWGQCMGEKRKSWSEAPVVVVRSYLNTRTITWPQISLRHRYHLLNPFLYLCLLFSTFPSALHGKKTSNSNIVRRPYFSALRTRKTGLASCWTRLEADQTGWGGMFLLDICMMTPFLHYLSHLNSLLANCCWTKPDWAD